MDLVYKSEDSDASEALLKKPDLELAMMDDKAKKVEIVRRTDHVVNEDNKSCMSRKCKAILFINLYCIFDTIDNINVKIGMEMDVKVMDLALSRICLNFISACFFVYFCSKHIFKDVPSRFNFHLTYRSVMLLVG